MRILGIFLLLLANFSVASIPEPSDEYVNDFANLINNTEQRQLRKKLEDTEYYSGVEVVVVTVKDFNSYSRDFSSWEDFSTRLFNKWGIGNIPINNGVMLLVAEKGRKIRIELGAGYPTHYDKLMQSIIDEVIYPQLKSDNYTKGIVDGAESIIEAVTYPVSFLEWYKWYILAGIGALISTIIALSIDKKKNPGLFWVLLGLAGFLVLGILRDLKDGESSDGFGGGSSDGGGASGGD